ncbi:hypothetical protein BKI52_15910 [marine bacterium AO1-C]|nr:hypothetical protein BKI52_15910 [marine bacterium AO1-C]
MKYLLLIVLMSGCFFNNKSLAQSKKQRLVDSLQTIIQNTSPDTLQVRACNELAWIYRNRNYKKSYAYASKAEKLANQLKDEKGLATAYNRLGLLHKNKGEYDKALGLYKKALEIEEKNNHLYGISRAKNQIGGIYIFIKRYKQAISFFEESIDILKRIGMTEKIAIKEFNIAICYQRLGNAKKSIEHYLKALEIYETSKNTNQIGRCYLGLGILYFKVKNFKDANTYYLKAIKIFERKKNKTSLAKAYHQIGVLHARLRDFTNAQKYYQLSLSIRKELGTKQGIQILMNDLSLTYLKQKQNRKAKELLDQSYAMSLEKKDSFALALVHTNLGIYHKQMKNYPSAIDYLKKGLDYFEKTKEKNHREKVLEYLSYTYAQMGQYDQSFAYFNRYNWARDSLETNFRQAMQIKDEYEAEKKKRELAEKDKKIKEAELARLKEYSFRQRLMNYFFGIGFLLSLIIVFAFIRNQQERRKVRKKQGEIEHLLKEQESIALNNMLEGEEKERNRIGQDLHDRLGSILSVVKLKFEALNQTSQILENESELQYQQAMQLLDDACDAVRKVSHNISSKTLKRFGLVAALKDLTGHLETDSLKTNLISQGFEDKELPDKYKVQIYRMIQELVGNVLKHAKATELAIQLFWRKDQLNISLEDNGQGFDTEQPKDEGLGLEGVKFRVKNLNGEFTLDSQPGQGTSILIDIPVQDLPLDKERGSIAM